MTPYGNRQGNSGVTAYKIAADHIDIRFNSGDIYRYSYHSPGKTDVERMKSLAQAGRGLATYISQVVRDRFDCKL